ncbi:MAG: SMP-30/gluconolactonase/LRE family protein [Rhizobiaceae bacterium]|nr:SMP-30/gluconolactonase/LRE family protein [Rhizobiaceae bacterium]
MKLDVEPLADVAAELGEGPLWSPAEGALYWFDLLGRVIFRTDATTGDTARLAISGMPTAIALRKGGGLLAALRNGFAFIDFNAGTETRLPSPMDFSRERFNDGKCDRRGRFFVGSMDKTLAEPIGGLFRLDPDQSFTRLATGMTLSNGLAWSPDDRILYHCDSRPGYVYAYDYDIETGGVAGRKLHIDFTGTGIHPDGCTVDAEGCLWIAELGAWTVGRYDPAGKRIGGIELPTRRVTSVTFGGDDLGTLFITTMRNNLTDTELGEQSHAGKVFVARPGVMGIAEVPFDG